MAVSHDTAVTATGLARMLSQFRGKPRFEALASSWLNEFQEIENALYAVYFARALQNEAATGDLLDKLGKIVGQPRLGTLDAAYSSFIKARIRANGSTGRTDDLIAILLLILGENAVVQVREQYPASVELEANGVGVNAYIVWRDFLNRAKAAGVRLRFFFGLQPKPSMLRRGSVSGGVTLTSSQRFGSVSVVGIGGGRAAGVF